MTKPLRPSLKFISILPTIKIKEEVETTNMVIWKVELDKPVNIMGDYLTFNSMIDLTTFYIGAVTLEQFSQERGWHYEMEIGIKRYLETCESLIDSRGEEWYLENKWWEWA